MITQITKGSNYLNHFCNNKVCFQGSIQLFLAYPYIWQRVKESEVYGSKKDIYFVPINKDGNHWVLVVFYANKKGKVLGQFCCWELIILYPWIFPQNLLFYDSMPSSSSKEYRIRILTFEGIVK